MEKRRVLAPALIVAGLAAMLAAGAVPAQPLDTTRSAIGGGPNGDGAPAAPFTRALPGARLSVGPTGIFVPGPNPNPGFTGTTIDFEGFAEATAISNQFANFGVTFSQNDAGLPEIDNNPFHFAYESAAPAGGGMLVGGTGGGAALATAGLVANFSPPVSRAGAYLSDTGPLGTYTITIFDVAGAVLDTISVDPADFPTISSFPNPDPSCDNTSPWEGTGCGVWVGFDVGSDTIARIQFGPSTVPSTDRFGIDDLVFASGPDLVVDSLTHDPANPNTEDNITFTAVVKNIGGSSADDSTLCFEIGGESCTLQPNDTLFGIPPLAPGEAATVVRNQGLSVAQSYTNTATADYNDDVAESDENNNTTTDSYTVTEAQDQAVLVYEVISLPANGSLLGLTGCSLSTPCILQDFRVTYQPNQGFTGSDFFEYRILDTRTQLYSLAALIDILVSNLPGSGVFLEVDFLGTGSGDVSLDVGGSVVAICSADCTEEFGPGDIVKLQARPIDTSSFSSWGGACAAAGSSQISTITLPASGTTTCTATFNP